VPFLTTLVTGASGFVGRATCEALVSAGIGVRAGLREPSSDFGVANTEPVIVGDVDAETSWGLALDGVDTVIHLAARVHVMHVADPDEALRAFRTVNCAGTLRLAERAEAAGVSRFVFISTIKVNGESTNGRKFSANDLVDPHDPYALSKYEAEKALHDMPSKMDIVIVRPTLVYGPGASGNLMRLCALAKRGIPVPFGGIRNRRDMIGVSNLADLLVACSRSPAAIGRTFLASDGHAVSTPQLFAAIAEAMNSRPRIINVSPSVLRRLGRVLRYEQEIKRLIGSLEVDCRPLMDTLGWQPAVSFDEGIAAMARHYLESRA